LEEGGGNPEGGGDNDARFMNSKGSYESGNEGILQYISSVANQSQPFLMFASLVNPHGEVICAPLEGIAEICRTTEPTNL